MAVTEAMASRAAAAPSVWPCMDFVEDTASRLACPPKAARMACGTEHGGASAKPGRHPPCLLESRARGIGPALLLEGESVSVEGHCPLEVGNTDGDELDLGDHGCSDGGSGSEGRHLRDALLDDGVDADQRAGEHPRKLLQSAGVRRNLSSPSKDDKRHKEANRCRTSDDSGSRMPGCS